MKQENLSFDQAKDNASQTLSEEEKEAMERHFIKPFASSPFKQGLASIASTEPTHMLNRNGEVEEVNLLNEMDGEALIKEAELFYGACEKFPLVDQTILYKGMRTHNFCEKLEKAEIQEGDQVVNVIPLAATLDLHVAKKYAMVEEGPSPSSLIFEITPSTSSFRNISHVSNDTTEQEVMGRLYTYFNIKKIEKVDEMWRIQVTHSERNPKRKLVNFSGCYVDSDKFLPLSPRAATSYTAVFAANDALAKMNAFLEEKAPHQMQEMAKILHPHFLLQRKRRASEAAKVQQSEASAKKRRLSFSN